MRERFLPQLPPRATCPVPVTFSFRPTQRSFRSSGWMRSASVQQVFSENCSTFGCVPDVPVGGGDCHVLLLHRLDLCPPLLYEVLKNQTTVHAQCLALPSMAKGQLRLQDEVRERHESHLLVKPHQASATSLCSRAKDPTHPELGPLPFLPYSICFQRCSPNSIETALSAHCL